VAFDLEKSAILAMVGGIDYSSSQFNRAIYARRQSRIGYQALHLFAAIDKGMPRQALSSTPPSPIKPVRIRDVEAKDYENKFYGPRR